MKQITGILLIFSWLLWAGCSSTRVYSDQVKGADFSAYKTYAWLPVDKDTTGQIVFDNEITSQNIREAADKEMAKRGYTYDSGNPDIFLRTHTIFEKRREIVQQPLYCYTYNYNLPNCGAGTGHPYYYFYNGLNPAMPFSAYDDVNLNNFTEGTIVIDAIDRKKNRLTWRGWAKEEVYDFNKVDELYENVEKIFKEYPVKKEKR
jgi:hypothetical protein